MKINGSNGSNINFIEQRSNSFEQLKKSKSKASSIEDRYEQKITNISYVNLTKSNESLGVLQMADSAVESLAKESENLQNLIQKSIHFPEQKRELETQFDTISERMLDIVDNTLYEQTQLFYTPMRLSAGKEEFNFSLGNEFGIEDFSIEDASTLKAFEQNLSDIKQNIIQTKEYVEVASFNALASVDIAGSYQIEDTLSKIFEAKTQEKKDFHKEDLSKAHDVSSLKDKISLLLGE